MLHVLARRALTALTIALLASASLMLVVALASPGAGAGAVPDAPSTTSNCGLVTCTTSPPPTVPSTSPATTAPHTTAPPTTRPVVRQTLPVNTTPRTTIPPPSTTATTLPSIGGNLPVTPSTVPFTTKQQSSHVSPVFAALSGAGLFLALVIVAVRFWITRPPR